MVVQSGATILRFPQSSDTPSPFLRLNSTSLRHVRASNATITEQCPVARILLGRQSDEHLSLIMSRAEKSPRLNDCALSAFRFSDGPREDSAEHLRAGVPEGRQRHQRTAHRRRAQIHSESLYFLILLDENVAIISAILCQPSPWFRRQRCRAC